MSFRSAAHQRFDGCFRVGHASRGKLLTGRVVPVLLCATGLLVGVGPAVAASGYVGSSTRPLGGGQAFPATIIAGVNGNSSGGGFAASGILNTNFASSYGCTSQTSLSTGHYPPYDCAQEGGTPSSQLLDLSGNSVCVTDSKPDSGSTFTWTATIPTTGNWEVETYIPYYTNYNTGPTYNYTSANGSGNDTALDQQSYAGGWKTITTQPFDAGDTYSVMLGTSDSSAGCQYTIADSVRWVWVSQAPSAYVANFDSDTVTPIDTATNTTGTPITVGDEPSNVAITPNGETAYVTNFDSFTVTPIDTATNTAGTPISVGNYPYGIAITPNGDTAYVTDSMGNGVTPIDTATNTAGTPITVSGRPFAIAIAPNGDTAYVTNLSTDSVDPINTATNTVGDPISVGDLPEAIAITPNGDTAYVANVNSDNVTPIDLATNTAGTPITVGSEPDGIAITPNGDTAYVENTDSDTVTPIDTATNTAGTPITVGDLPYGIAITPNGDTAYVSNSGGDTVTPIDTATNTAGTPVTVGSEPGGVSVTPDQAPVAELSVTPAPVGSPTSFDASASVALSSPIASYAWNFGDGNTATTASPITSHTYSTSGNFNAKVTETDNAGTSTTQVFTGQTVSLEGGEGAVASQSFVIVACSANSLCSGAVHNTLQSSSVSGTSSTDATLSVSIGEQVVSCGKAAAQSEQVTSYSTTTFTASALDASMTIKSDSIVAGFKVCYSSTTPFIDKHGNSVTAGVLPDCTAVGNVAPCIVSTTISGGNLVVDLSVPTGDPRMWGAPVLSTFTPTEAAVGANVTIRGGPLKGASEVEFDGTPTQFKVNGSGTKITAVVPAGAQSGPITIVTPDGVVKSKNHFTVT